MSYDLSSNAPQARIRYVAVGDSFSEGVGDERPDGSTRGWAGLLAQGLADATGEPVQYANLAIRGRKMRAILEEQLEPAIALKPTMISFNGGGNDMLRPQTDIPWIMQRTREALQHIQAAGIEPLLIAGADPTGGLPGGSRTRAKGDEMTVAAYQLAAELDVRFCDNWSSVILKQRGYWSPDRLHLAPVGHRRVAANVLQTLGYEVPADWEITAPAVPKPSLRQEVRYTREHVAPWVKRRLTGRSSGDGRSPQHPEFVWVLPGGSAPTA